MVLCSRSQGAEADDRPIPCVVLEGSPCSACKERATIRQKIKQLEEEITKLNAKYNSLTTTMNGIHDPFIHKLPPEIGSHIFRLCLPTLDYGERDYCVDRIPSEWALPLRLGAVCRRWRQLAWATPNLWETLFLTIGPSTRYSLAELLPFLLREWIGRSGALPLTIFFVHSGWPHRMDEDDALSEGDSPSDEESLSEDDPPSENESTSEDESPSEDESTSEDESPSEIEGESADNSTFDKCTIDTLKVTTYFIIEILNFQSGRWRSLYLHAGADIFKRFSDYTKPMRLVELELSLNLAAHAEQSQWETPKFKMDSEPNPTHLKLTNFPVTSTSIRWDSVTHATLYGICVAEGLDFLRRAPCLEYYHVFISKTHEISYSSNIFHARLRSLHLLSTQSSSVEIFLREISLPSLEEWTQNTSDHRLPVAAMLSFLNRSCCSLKALSLEAIPPQSMDLSSLLQAIPSIEWLQLCFEWGFLDTTVMDDILTRIFCSVPGGSDILANTTPEPFLPQLQFIECLTESPAAPFSWDRIPQLYRQGHRWSLALRSAAFPSHITDETGVQILQLVDEGVGLEIHDRHRDEDFLTSFRNRMHNEGII